MSVKIRYMYEESKTEVTASVQRTDQNAHKVFLQRSIWLAMLKKIFHMDAVVIKACRSSGFCISVQLEVEQ